MSDEAALARSLFPQAAAETKPAPTPKDAPVAAKLFPQAAKAEQQQAQPKSADAKSKPAQQDGKSQEQPKPAQDAKAGDQQQQSNPAIVQAAAEITSTLADLGFDPAHADSASFGTLAAELGLKADGAKRLAEWDQQRSQNAWDQASNNWHAEAKTDPLYSDNVSAGGALIQEFGDDRLMQEVIDLGFGNHPAVISFMGRVGRALETARRNRRS